MISPSIAKHELRRRAFRLFPQVAKAFDGSPIRNVAGAVVAQQACGYMCSPIAYSIREQFKDTNWCNAGERDMTNDELLTIIIADECRP